MSASGFDIFAGGDRTRGTSKATSGRKEKSPKKEKSEKKEKVKGDGASASVKSEAGAPEPSLASATTDVSAATAPPTFKFKLVPREDARYQDDDLNVFTDLYVKGATPRDFAEFIVKNLSPEAKANAGRADEQLEKLLAEQMCSAIEAVQEMQESLQTGASPEDARLIAEGIRPLISFVPKLAGEEGEDAAADEAEAALQRRREEKKEARRLLDNYAPHLNANGPMEFDDQRRSRRRRR